MKFFFFLFLFYSNFTHATNWTILANGPEIPASALVKYWQNGKVIALDGAANRLRYLSLYPDVILGDFDSIEEPNYWGIQETFFEIDKNTPPYLGNFAVIIVPAKNQDYTDLEKGILYCDAQKASAILIVQATGGRMDHTLGNLGLLRKYYQKNRTLILETDREKILFLKDSEIRITKDVENECAIMGYPQAILTSNGLAYDCVEYPLSLGIQESVCNKLIAPEATISIQGEALVIVPKSAIVAFLSVDR